MKMSKYVSYVGRFIIIDIVNPIFTMPTYSRVRINKKYITDALKTSRLIVVRTPKGELIRFPQGFKKLKTVKEVFLRPDEPMEMYELDILHCDKRPKEFFQVA